MFQSKKPSSPRPSGPRVSVDREGVTATVKWFNPEKGYGFASPADGSGDLFLHISALGGVDPYDLPPGSTIVCDIGTGQRGPQIAAVHEVDKSTAEQAPRGGGGGGGGMGRGPRPGGGGGGGGGRFGGGGGGGGGYGGGGGRYESQGSGERVTGTVKFFNTQRGFGFVGREDGGEDVFLHAQVLMRAGLPLPQEGQRVRFSTRQGQRGLQVDQIEYT